MRGLTNVDAVFVVFAVVVSIIYYCCCCCRSLLKELTMFTEMVS